VRKATPNGQNEIAVAWTHKLGTLELWAAISMFVVATLILASALDIPLILGAT
jgi:hypothetical protein